MTHPPQWLEPVDPCTGQPTGCRIAMTDPGAIPSMAGQLRAALEQERATSRDIRTARAEGLGELARLVHARSQEIANMISRETGKPRGEAFLCEIVPVMLLSRHFARHARRILRDTNVHTFPLLNKSSTLIREPYGLVSIVTPWNYPFGIAMCQIAAALAAGNAVLWKPSELTPQVAELGCELLRQVGLGHIVATAQGGGQVGAATIEVADLVSFTGSTETGRTIQARAAANITPVILELGGKDPLLVLPSADIKQAARFAVWGAMTNAGQVCSSVERAYVHASVAEPFLAEVVRLIETIKVGTPDEGADMGPLISERQRSIVRCHVQDATAKGASLLAGGYDLDRPGFFYAPTVLSQVDKSMRVFQEETFGPVLPIQVMDSVDDMVRAANDSPFGLGASVFGARQEARRIARCIEAGTVTVNDLLFTYGLPNSPWGGHKQSGIGHTHGTLGLLNMTHVKEIASPRAGAPQPYLGFPYHEALQQALHRMLRWFI